MPLNAHEPVARNGQGGMVDLAQKLLKDHLAGVANDTKASGQLVYYNAQDHYLCTVELADIAESYEEYFSEGDRYEMDFENPTREQLGEFAEYLNGHMRDGSEYRVNEGQNLLGLFKEKMFPKGSVWDIVRALPEYNTARVMSGDETLYEGPMYKIPYELHDRAARDYDAGDELVIYLAEGASPKPTRDAGGDPEKFLKLTTDAHRHVVEAVKQLREAEKVANRLHSSRDNDIGYGIVTGVQDMVYELEGLEELLGEYEFEGEADKVQAMLRAFGQDGNRED